MKGQNNFYNVFVNGTLVQVVSTKSRVSHYPLEWRFDPNESTKVLITKRTEAQVSTKEENFLGLEVDDSASLVALPPAAERRLEFLGDSITCGFGILARGNSPGCKNPEGRVEDNWVTYGPLVSRRFGGEQTSL